ncbi:hypothetical protein N0V88_004661 [Collariella sp. IMI 366227]|nr:hypothetical protein N0V88_004661 [Collariella sp. IMI 366227]
MPPEKDVDEEPVNLLSFDGGGVRGVSSLVILDEIMRHIRNTHGLAEVPKPCDFFHMIAGTSTGGIFSRDNRKTWSLSAKFKATALQEVVEAIVKERNMGEDMWDVECPHKGKAVVCVMPSNLVKREPRLVRSYPGDNGVDDRWDMGIKIWEAARATTAASSYFKPQLLGNSATAQPFIDAAIGVNNPVDHLLKEAVSEFGFGRQLGCVVSIGTGTRDLVIKTEVSSWRKPFGTISYYKSLLKALKSTATDGEEPHRLLQARLDLFPGSYFRFNVPDAAEKVELHHYKKIPELKEMTVDYLKGVDVTRQIQQIAKGLTTNSFDHAKPEKEQITTLEDGFSEECSFEVTPFNLSDAVHLLVKASGCDEPPPDSEEMGTAQGIVIELGLLPLAIDKAGAVMRQLGLTLDEYHQQLQKQKIGNPEKSCFNDDEPGDNLVNAALDVSYQAIDACRPKGFPPDVTSAFKKRLPVCDYQRYLALLYFKYGWYCYLTKDFKLAEEVLKESLRISNLEWGHYSLDALNVVKVLGSIYLELGRLGEAEQTFRELCERIRGRSRDIEAIELQAEDPQEPGPREREKGDFDEDNVHLLRLEYEVKALTEAGNIKYWDERVSEMESLVEKGTAYLESGAFHHFMINHADSSLKNGEWEHAAKVYRRVCQILERLYGPCDRKILEILRRLVDCEVEGDNYDGAIEIAKDCLSRARRVYGNNHRETVLTLDKLAWVMFFRRLGEAYEELLEVLKEALTGAKLAFGDHWITQSLEYRMAECRKTIKGKEPDRSVQIGGVSRRELCAAWRRNVRHLKEMQAEFGPNHILVRRLAHLMKDGPSFTRRELYQRMLAAYGPHSHQLKKIQGWAESADGAGDYDDSLTLCSCGQPPHGEESLVDEFSDSSESDSEDAMANTLDYWKSKPIYMTGFYTY